jgi:hemolysin activation/secretion protein
MKRVGLSIIACALSGCGVALAADAPGETFDIFEYRVLGNSVLPTIEVERAVLPLLGPGKTLDDVEHARTALETLYHDKGYGTVFVDIPEQDVGEGVVRLRVTEGTIERVRVTGARYFSNREIRAAVPAAKTGIVPHLPTLQKELTDLNTQTPDRNAVPVLKAGSRPGTVALALTVKDELPLHGSVELNNQYTSDTTELRAIASASYDNLFGRLDSLSFQYQTAPEEPDEATVWAASYTARLPDGKSKLALFYVDSDSDVATVGDAGGTVPVLGKGEILGLRYVRPLVASAAQTHIFTAGVEYKDFAESVLSEKLLRTPITYVNFSVGHTSAWRTERQQWSLMDSVGFGVRDLANDTEEFRDKRSEGNPNYWLLRSGATYAVRLPSDFSASLIGVGQYAIDPVISNEQFSIAGADGVRGYLEAEQLGDVGAKISFEFGLPQLTVLDGRFKVSSFLFYDYGRISHLEPLRNRDVRSADFGKLLEEPDRTLRSFGAALLLNWSEHFNGSLVWAYPLVDGSTDPGTHKGDSRIHFVVRSIW